MSREMATVHFGHFFSISIYGKLLGERQKPLCPGIETNPAKVGNEGV
jgi:hypothetical protein